MTIDWLTGDDDADAHTERVGVLRNGLSMLFRAGEQTADGLTEFVASTATVDRMSDVVDQQTWRLAYFRANPVILYEHAAPVIGRAERVSRTKGDDGWFRDLRIAVRWDESESNPVGRLAAEQHRNGFRRAVSVGFIPGESISRRDLPQDDPLHVDESVSRWSAGYVFRHSELLEVSSVAVPANRDALQLSMHASETDDPLEACIRLVRGSVRKSTADDVLDAIRTDPRVRRAVEALILDHSAPRPAKSAGLDHFWSYR